MWTGYLIDMAQAILAAVAGDSSINVTLVGGAVGGQTVAQGDPNAGAGDAWPVKVQAGNTPVDSTHGLPVVDQGLTIIACGNLTASASTAALPSQTGAGYCTVINTEAAGGKTMYIGPTPASTSSFPLPPGASRTIRLADVTTLFVYGTGGTFGWELAR